MCSEDETFCTSPEKARKLSAQEAWIVNGRKIEYCLSQQQPQHCKLQFSRDILIAVIICNVVKAVTMFWIVWQQREVTFVTFGDAVASWLDEPDLMTANRCLQDVRSATKQLEENGSQIPQNSPKQHVTGS